MELTIEVTRTAVGGHDHFRIFTTFTKAAGAEPIEAEETCVGTFALNCSLKKLQAGLEPTGFFEAKLEWDPSRPRDGYRWTLGTKGQLRREIQDGGKFVEV